MKTYKRLDVRAIYTDDNQVYLRLADGRLVAIQRVTEHYSRATLKDTGEPKGAIHKITPNEILNSESIAF